jgi:RNA polymerase sigma-70 factor (ECF subfamily)
VRLLRRRSKRATPTDDATLLARLRERDEDAFAELVERYDASLRRVVRAYVSTDAVADDVVGETWLGVLRGIDAFEGRSSLKTWLFRIAINRAKTRGTREARTIPFSSLVSAESESDEPAVDPDRFDTTGQWGAPPTRWDQRPVAKLLNGELRRQLDAAIEKLPEAQRAVLVMRDVEGLDSADVSEALGVTPGNQRVLLHRARSRVRNELEGYMA